MKQQASKPKVLVVFPRFNARDATHYPYWYRLFDEAGKQLDLVILFESGSQFNKYFSNISSIYLQKFQSKPLNIIERFFLLIKYISQGYSNVYVHYSYWTVMLAWIIKYSSFAPNITIYYWDCEKYETKPKNFMLEIALKLTDVLVTGHEVVATSYRNVFNFTKPIKIVPNWVDEVRSTECGVRSNLSENPEHTNILFVHHLSPRKGSRELPEIIKQTLERIPNAHFYIVGDGPDLENLKFQIAKLKHEKFATIHGALAHEQTATLYKTADVFIMPSRSEGFPRVILEAMSYGLPIVSTDVGCVRELLGPLQREFVSSTSGFPEKIAQLLTTKDIETIGQENKKLVKKYSISNATEAFINLFVL